MQEEWKDIVGYEGVYSISSLGKVISHSRLDITGKRLLKEKERKAHLKDGYIDLRDTEGKTTRYVFVDLVYLTFIGDIGDDEYVILINDNNGYRVDNLQIIKGQRYKKFPVFQMLGDTIIAQYPSIMDACESMKGRDSGALISACCRGLYKSAYGYQWKYAE